MLQLAYYCCAQDYSQGQGSQHHVPALVALRPDPAADSCVGPQKVVNSVGSSNLELQNSLLVCCFSKCFFVT